MMAAAEATTGGKRGQKNPGLASSSSRPVPELSESLPREARAQSGAPALPDVLVKKDKKG